MKSGNSILVVLCRLFRLVCEMSFIQTRSVGSLSLWLRTKVPRLLCLLSQFNSMWVHALSAFLENESQHETI